MKTIILFTSIAVACGLLFVNLYTSLVDARAWGNDIPHSIGTAREYFSVVNPGNFFRIFSPLNQLFGLLALIIFWKSVPGIRIYLCVAFVMYLLAEGLTFGYFYPRNEIMFKTAQLTNIDLLKKVWSEWSAMNWLRSVLLLIGIFFSFLSLYRLRG